MDELIRRQIDANFCKIIDDFVRLQDVVVIVVTQVFGVVD